ncbi:MAG: PorT family protein [Prevotella sp.]|nr:PorT family protein [Prevotella sp.]
MSYLKFVKVLSLVKGILPFCLLAFLPFTVCAQIGEYRNEFAVGVNGGLSMSTIDFLPEVPQSQLMGKTVGLTMRYTGEKYFKSICAIVAEVNYTQMGWQQRIWDLEDQPVINSLTKEPEEYSRKINYIQVPVFARLGWGRERRGLQAYFQAGPQVGYMLSEKTEANYDLERANLYNRASPVYNQETMPVENKFDYGIAAALGVELSLRRLGHFMLEGRYYYGLGNIYGNSKRDYFAKSPYQNIVVKATYLFDITRSKNPKIK